MIQTGPSYLKVGGSITETMNLRRTAPPQITGAMIRVTPETLSYYPEDAHPLEACTGAGKAGRALQEGATVGGVLGVILVVAIIIGAILFCCRVPLRKSLCPSEEDRLEAEIKKNELRAAAARAKGSTACAETELEINRAHLAQSSEIARNSAQKRVNEGAAGVTVAEARIHAATQRAEGLAYGVAASTGTPIYVRGEPVEAEEVKVKFSQERPEV
jgi:hypothetical protein